MLLNIDSYWLCANISITLYNGTTERISSNRGAVTKTLATFEVWYQRVQNVFERIESRGAQNSGVQQLRREVQPKIGDSQASLLDAMRSMLAEFKRDNGRSESGSAEGSAAVGASAVWVAPTAVGESRARARHTAVPDMIFRDGGLRNFGEMGRGQAAAPVEVGLERGQPDQSGRAGEMDVCPSGEFDGGFGLPSSCLAYKHPSTFSGLKEDSMPCIRDAWYLAKGAGFLVAFVSIPPQYIPIGELHTGNAALVQRGVSLESVQRHTLAWNFILTAPKSKSDKRILHSCTSPREAWDALLAWYGPQMAGGKSDLSRRLNSFKMAPGNNPLEDMGRIEDLATEMRTAGLALDNHMLYTIYATHHIY